MNLFSLCKMKTSADLFGQVAYPYIITHNVNDVGARIFFVSFTHFILGQISTLNVLLLAHIFFRFLKPSHSELSVGCRYSLLACRISVCAKIIN